MGLPLCVFAFAVSFLLARRSLGAGLAAVLSSGYVYGLLRARFYDPFSYFIFDAAVLGLYLERLTGPEGFWPDASTRALYRWVAALIGWPVAMFGLSALYPQHVLVQLVGLRAAVWFVPFLLLGASIRSADLIVIARALAVLNLIALAFGVGEYVLGLEPFFPHNPITELIYRSIDVAGHSNYRIPATFPAAANYGMAMVASVPLLAGIWRSAVATFLDKLLMPAGLFAAALGTFLCASRTPVVFLLVLAVPIAYHLRARLGYFLLALLIGGTIAYIVSGEERMQRFTTLQDPDVLNERVVGSVNLGVVDVLLEYPAGAGLGSAFGTNIPTILRQYASEQIGAENEYARIGVEQGLAGLALWVGFLVWLLVRRRRSPLSRRSLGMTLMYTFVALSWAVALLSVGTLTAIPCTAMLLLQMGILSRTRPDPVPVRDAARARVNGDSRVPQVVG
jgi:hypothetical protein